MLKPARALGWRIWILVACAVLVALIATIRPGRSLPRELRVGADDAPPYHVIQADGSVRGLAVDVLNEAARRKNLRLIWVPVRGMKLDQALDEGIVDAWPAVSRTPERELRFHFSQPWLESSYCLVSRKASAVTRANSSGVRLGVATSPRVSSVAHQYFKESVVVRELNNLAAVVGVCNGDVQGAILDSRTLDSVLLDRPAGCGEVALRIQLIPEASNPVSIASRPQSAALADDLSSAIPSLATDGTFSAAVDRWSGFSAGQTRSYFDLREKALFTRAGSYALLILATVGLVLLWLFMRTRRAKVATERALARAADSEARFQNFMNNSPFIGFIKDGQGRMVYMNRRFSEVFQRSAEDVLGKDDFELWPRETAADLRRNDLAILRGNKPMEVTETISTPERTETRWLSVKFPFSMGGQTLLGGISVDITDRARSEQALRESEERFRTAFAHAAIGMALTDIHDRIIQVNPAFCEITGYDLPELLGVKLSDLVHSDDREASLNRLLEVSRGNHGKAIWQKRLIRKNGEVVWVRDSIGLVRNAKNEPTHFIRLLEDVSREKLAQDQARESEERWQLALEGANDGIWDWDARHDTVYYSVRWKEMLGYREWEIPNDPEVWARLVHPEDLEAAQKAIEDHLAGMTPHYHAEYRIRCKNGAYKWIMARGKAVCDDDGKPVRMIGSHADVTERKRAEELLFYQANHDSLTGLASRGNFLAQLEWRVARAHQNGTPLSLCICDIDRFKHINDTWGHQWGDEVLVSLAETFRSGIRSTDLGGRMGGDEFYLLLTDSSALHAATCLERIRNDFEALRFGSAETGFFRVTASFGVARLEPGMISEQLIGAADMALYGAKHKGRNLVLAGAIR